MSLSSSTVGGKIKFKIVLLGDQHVGKTSIIERFINDRYETSYDATIGIDFLVRNLTYQNKNYRLQLWDTAGQQRFRSLIPSYLKDSNLCLLVYDLGEPKSLENLSIWQQLYNKHKQYTAFSIAIGNKSDRPSQCSEDEVNKKLQQIGVTHHFKISAKTGDGITQLFHSAIDLITHNINNLKIIDQIDEKEEKDQQRSAKIVTKNGMLQGGQSASIISTIKLQREQVEQRDGHRRICC